MSLAWSPVNQRQSELLKVIGTHELLDLGWQKAPETSNLDTGQYEFQGKHE